MVWIDEPVLLVGQQNICKNQTGVKRSELMSVKMQSCALFDDCDKEIKIAGRVSELDLSCGSIKHDLIPLTFLLYQR